MYILFQFPYISDLAFDVSNIPYTNIAKYTLGDTSEVGSRHPSETAIFSAVHVAKSCFCGVL